MPVLEKGVSCSLKSCFCGSFAWVALHLCTRSHLRGSHELKVRVSWSIHTCPQHWLILVSLPAHPAFLHAVSSPQAQEGGKPVEHSKGHNPLPHNSAGEKSWILKFTAVSLRLVLLPIRRNGELSLAEASDVAPEKPEGT